MDRGWGPGLSGLPKRWPIGGGIRRGPPGCRTGAAPEAGAASVAVALARPQDQHVPVAPVGTCPAAGGGPMFVVDDDEGSLWPRSCDRPRTHRGSCPPQSRTRIRSRRKRTSPASMSIGNSSWRRRRFTHGHPVPDSGELDVGVSSFTDDLRPQPRGRGRGHERRPLG